MVGRGLAVVGRGLAVVGRGLAVVGAQADSLLFPSFRASLQQLHEHCFHRWCLPYRELCADELGDAVLGWDILIPPSVRVHYLLPSDAPFGVPVVKLVQPDPRDTNWRHVELDGTMCLLAPGQNAVPLLEGAAVDLIIHALFQVIQANFRLPDGQEPVSARHRWVNTGVHGWCLLDPEDGGDRAIAALVPPRWVIAFTRSELDAWLENSERSADAFAAVRLFRVADFADVPDTPASLTCEQRICVENGGLGVFIVNVEAGPIIVAIRMDCSGELERMRIDRADRRWLHDRGGSGLQEEVAAAHVVIVGCGSLGGGVAELLTKAGVGRLTLIDPEMLSWDNVARHVLGGEAAGMPKVEQLAHRLRAHIPTIHRIEAFQGKWQDVAAKRPRALRSDAIVSTIAAWPDEMALAEWSRVRGIPLILGWVEARGAAGHAVSLRGGCLGCQLSPDGVFRREVSQWEDGSPIRFADGCHENFLPFGHMDVVPTQSLIARLVLEVLTGQSVEAVHWSLIPSLSVLTALGARPSRDYLRQSMHIPPQSAWSERRRDWKRDEGCWYCGGSL